MIYVDDDFLDVETLDSVITYLTENEFKKLTAGDKDFWCQMSNDDFDAYVLSKLEMKEQKELRSVFSFFRVSNDELDTDWRIHADTVIMGEQPERAIVLYLSDSYSDGLHGTAFWEHVDMGYAQPLDVTDDEFDEILLRDSDDLDKWSLNSVVGYKPNRLVSYPCNYFHSKYPNKSWKEGRVVFVMFYTTK